MFTWFMYSNCTCNGSLGNCPGSLSSGCNCQLGCNNQSALTGQGQAPTCDGNHVVI